MTDRSPTPVTEDRVTDTRTRTRSATARDDAATSATIAWLESEFPGWTIEVDETSTWEGDLRALWIARREGHHPQAEMSPAKLHTRLDDYLNRNERRQALSN
ncbi:MAG: hypothetical protein ACLGIR_00890 [Actinomycetes bacterium]